MTHVRDGHDRAARRTSTTPTSRRRPRLAQAVCTVSAAALTLFGAARPAQAAPRDAAATALQIQLAGGAGTPPVAVTANATVGSVSAPPNEAVTAVSVSAALAAAAGVTAAGGTASASTTLSATQSQGQSTVHNFALTVLDASPITAGTLSGTATCPVGGAPIPTTVVTNLSVLGTPIDAQANGGPVTVSSPVTLAGITGAQLVATVYTQIQDANIETTAAATALQASLSVTGTVAGLPVTIPLGTFTAGQASCETPLAATAAPTATGLSPTSGPTAGGTTVTVTGTGFVPGQTTVRIGNTAIRARDVTSPTSLSVVTPAGRPVLPRSESPRRPEPPARSSSPTVRPARLPMRWGSMLPTRVVRGRAAPSTRWRASVCSPWQVWLPWASSGPVATPSEIDCGPGLSHRAADRPTHLRVD